jgi:hypothetical protein
MIVDEKEFGFPNPNLTTQEVEKYLSRGRILAEVEPFVQQIKDLIEGFVPTSESATPFIVFEDSSGYGKTQMAFSLMAMKMKVLYIPCNNTGIVQPIYGAFALVSHSFEYALQKDLRILGNYDEDFLKAYTNPLAMYTFLYAYMTGETDMSKVLTRRQLEDYLDQHQKPVIFLDEFPRLHESQGKKKDGNEDKLRYMRNVFRALGLVVICSSTNATAINLRKFGTHSRIPSVHWCTVIPRFPNFRMNVCNDVNIPKIFLPVLKASRPYFANLVCSFLKGWIGEFGISFLDQLGKYIYDEVSNSKRGNIGGQNEFDQGQASLFLGASFRVSDSAQQGDQTVSSHLRNQCSLIDGHFGRLDEPGIFRLFTKRDGVSKQNETSLWTPSVKFDNEPLMIMFLMGGKEYFPIPEGKYFWSLVMQVKKTHRIVCDLTNVVQSANDGLLLEAMSVGAIALASRRNGFAGIDFRRFLEILVSHLISRDLSIAEFPEQISRFQNHVIPPLSPPNVPWHDSWDGFELNLKNLRRTRNKERIDFEVDEIGLTGECKDHKSALKLATLKNIIVRVPNHSKIHLVFTNKIQKSYFGSKTEWFDSSEKVKTAVSRLYPYYLKVDKSNASLEPVPGFTAPPHPECLFLLIPIWDVASA